MSEPKLLLPCPFCGSPAETDGNRDYRAFGSGRVGRGVAVYCTQCNADMMYCCEDLVGCTPEDILGDLVENWNKRTELLACQQEIEQLQKEMDRMVEDTNKLMESARHVRTKLWRERDEARQQAAAMREALRWLHMASICADPATSAASRRDCLICKALATNAGRDYISRGEASQIAEALNDCKPWVHNFQSPKMKQALTCARELGLLEDAQ